MDLLVPIRDLSIGDHVAGHLPDVGFVVFLVAVQSLETSSHLLRLLHQHSDGVEDLAHSCVQGPHLLHLRDYIPFLFLKIVINSFLLALLVEPFSRSLLQL